MATTHMTEMSSWMLETAKFLVLYVGRFLFSGGAYSPFPVPYGILQTAISADKITVLNAGYHLLAIMHNCDNKLG